jgi:hypothetical protein
VLIEGTGSIVSSSGFDDAITIGEGFTMEESAQIRLEGFHGVTVLQEAFISIDDEAAIVSDRIRTSAVPGGFPDIVINGNSSASPASIQSYGTFVHDISDVLFRINTSFYSDGLIEVRAGSLSLRAESEITGTAKMEGSGATIILDGGTALLRDLEIMAVKDPEDGSLPGNFEMKKGTTIFDGNVTAENILLSGASLIGSSEDSELTAKLQLRGSNTWSGGKINGRDLINPPLINVDDGASLLITGGGFKNIADPLIINNDGIMTLEGSLQLILGFGVELENKESGVFVFDGNSTVGKSGSSMYFANDGVIEKISGDGTSRINVPGKNQGFIRCDTGVLELSNEFINGPEGRVIPSGGTVRWNGGLRNLRSLSGWGNIDSDVENEGTISVSDQDGPLNVTGGLVNTAKSSIVSQIDSDTPNVEPQLNIGGTATLAGILEVSHSLLGEPEEGDFIPVLEAGTIAGSFDQVIGPATGDSEFFWGQGMREVEGRTRVGIEFQPVTKFEEFAAAIIPAEERKKNGGAYWDPDGDGVPFLFEHAMGLDNEVFNAFPVSSELMKLDGQTLLTITFPFLKTTSDFLFKVEKSDLINPWEIVAPESLEIIPGEGAVDTHVITIGLPNEPESAGEFYRLSIETL